jgi:hypothetical protein
VKEKLDPSWHKARVAARIWLKAQKRPLNARDRRLARLLAADCAVSDRLIQQGILWFLGGPYRVIQTTSGPKRVLEALDNPAELSNALDRAN